jgi:hypothetical protein
MLTPMAKKQRVGAWTITIEPRRTHDFVGIGERWSAQVDGHVTVLANGEAFGLYVGTTKGVVSRLETETGRQCGRYELDAPIEAIAIAGKRVTVTTRNGDTVLLAGSLRVPKR